MSPTISQESSSVEHQGFRASSPSLADNHDYSIQKHRKQTSTGGGRAWTDEEESYLLRTRMHKMPYKHIAAHLHKTELACRLHYHQMSYGSNRRKRTGSVSSTSSTVQNPLSALHELSPVHTPFTHLSPVPSPPSSPESTASKPCSYGSTSPHQATQQRSPAAHVPILPKPVPSPPCQYSGPTTSDLTKSSLRLDTYNLSPKPFMARPPPQPQTQPQPQSHPLLHPHPHAYGQHVDQARLRTLYAHHRLKFWTQIASDYGSSLSPSQLEEAFLSSNPTFVRGTSPPTPGMSPQSSCMESVGPTCSYSAPALTAVESKGGLGFAAINAPTPVTTINTAVSAPSPVERCSVSSLLTEEKEVRRSEA